MRAMLHKRLRTCAYCRRQSRRCRSRPVIALRPAGVNIDTSTIGVAGSRVAGCMLSPTAASSGACALGGATVTSRPERCCFSRCRFDMESWHAALLVRFNHHGGGNKLHNGYARGFSVQLPWHTRQPSEDKKCLTHRQAITAQIDLHCVSYRRGGSTANGSCRA
jgi:hypothetical protein